MVPAVLKDLDAAIAAPLIVGHVPPVTLCREIRTLLTSTVMSRIRGDNGRPDPGYALLTPQERRVLELVAEERLSGPAPYAKARKPDFRVYRAS